MTDFVIQFNPKVLLEEISDRKIKLRNDFKEVLWEKPSLLLQQIVSDLKSPGKKISALKEIWKKSNFSDCLYYLEKFEQNGILSYSIYTKSNEIIATYYSTCFQDLRPRFFTQVDQITHTLSRFAFLRNRNGEFVLETPLAAVEIILYNPIALEIIHAISSPKKLSELKEKFSHASEILVSFLHLLESGSFLETKDPSLDFWEFHDLLFHARTRLGRHSNPYGKRNIPLEATSVEEKYTSKRSHRISLIKPIQDDTGLSFNSVLNRRQTIRTYGEIPISLELLGEFLYRVTRKTNSDARVNPSAGRRYELEFYFVINRCTGLEQGLYQYDSLSHSLLFLEKMNRHVLNLLNSSKAATGLEELPQVLIILSAKFQRMQSSYSSLSYSLVMKDVGVLFQTMYLVATYLGLAPCALGSGNSDLFSKLAQTDYYLETSVGEFLLGSLPQQQHAPQEQTFPQV